MGERQVEGGALPFPVMSEHVLCHMWVCVYHVQKLSGFQGSWCAQAAPTEHQRAGSLFPIVLELISSWFTDSRLLPVSLQGRESK